MSKEIQSRDGARPAQASSGRIRVLVVDDHPAVRDALSEAIRSKLDLQLVGEVDSANAAFEALARERPDVAVVDVVLGDADGLDLVQNLRAQYPDLAVVIFSMYDETIYAERALRAGASGYLMKSAPTQEVIEGIRSVARGDIYLSRSMSSRMLSKLAGGAKPAGPGVSLDDLTDRELSVFQMMGQGYSVEKIAQRLNLSRKTVETYRRRAKEKMGFDTVTELLQFAIRWTYGQAGH